MATSPIQDADGDLRVSLYVGEARADGASSEDCTLLSVHIRQALNEIPSATLVLVDGDMPNGSFPLSDRSTFAPGARVRVAAGYGDTEATVFTGIVVRHGIRITSQSASTLVLECRATALKLTLGRRTAQHRNLTDSELFTRLIEGAGLRAQVEATDMRHEALVQFDCSDWDFLLARADALGLLVTVDDDLVRVHAPALQAEPALGVRWGIDLMDFSADLDASTQWTAVQASSWHPDVQVVEQGAAAHSTDTGQGNLSGRALAAVLSPALLSLPASPAQPRPVLDAWARAVQCKAALARVRGHATFQGSALAKPGELLELAGVGDRFNGKALMSAVTHTLADGKWTTCATLGLDPGSPAALPNGSALGVQGLHIATVLGLEGDPAGQSRIRVRSANAGADVAEGLWARLLQPQASSAFGSFCLPEIGDEVLVGHLQQDPAQPVVLGSLYSSAHQPPYPLQDENAVRGFVTRSGHRIEVNDRDNTLTLRTARGNQVDLSDADRRIQLQDEHGNRVTLSAAGIALHSPRDIALSALGGIRLDAVAGIALHAQADVQLTGLNVACQAQVAVSAQGAASAELSSSGATTVAGALVRIN